MHGRGADAGWVAVATRRGAAPIVGNAGLGPIAGADAAQGCDYGEARSRALSGREAGVPKHARTLRNREFLCAEECERGAGGPLSLRAFAASAGGKVQLPG